jgi:hypothetical protein
MKNFFKMVIGMKIAINYKKDTWITLFSITHQNKNNNKSIDMKYAMNIM